MTRQPSHQMAWRVCNAKDSISSADQHVEPMAGACSSFAFLDGGGQGRVQDLGPLDVRDYLGAAKAYGL